MTNGPTTVEEFLAGGGTITRERSAEEEQVEHLTIDGVEFEFVADDTALAPFRCRLTDVYGHRGSHHNRFKSTRPYRCHKSCGSFGTVFRHGWYWCEQHAPAGAGEHSS